MHRSNTLDRGEANGIQFYMSLMPVAGRGLGISEFDFRYELESLHGFGL